MHRRHWIMGTLGAAGLAVTLAFAPLTSAQQTTLPTTPAALMTDAGYGRGGGGGGGGGGTGSCTGTNFVDENNDGVCDNAGTGTGQGSGGGGRGRGRP